MKITPPVTIKELRRVLENLPEDLPVALAVDGSEHAFTNVLCDGALWLVAQKRLGPVH
jgi:hypothetical protein